MKEGVLAARSCLREGGRTVNSVRGRGLGRGKALWGRLGEL